VTLAPSPREREKVTEGRMRRGARLEKRLRSILDIIVVSANVWSWRQ